MKDILRIIFLVILVLAVDFLLSALLVKMICWAFGLKFAWKYVVGIWAILALVRSIFKQSK